MDSEGKPVHVVIRSSPFQNTSDQTIDCKLSWTVLRLKNEISKVYPTKPVPDKQRLIYFGHLLENDSILKDVLRQDELNYIHVMHLLCIRSKASDQNDGSVSEDTNTEQHEDHHDERTNTTPERIVSRVNDSQNGGVRLRFSCQFDLELTIRPIPSRPRFAGQSSQQSALTDPVLICLLLLLAFLFVLTGGICYWIA